MQVNCSASGNHIANQVINSSSLQSTNVITTHIANIIASQIPGIVASVISGNTSNSPSIKQTSVQIFDSPHATVQNSNDGKEKKKNQNEKRKLKQMERTNAWKEFMKEWKQKKTYASNARENSNDEKSSQPIQVDKIPRKKNYPTLPNVLRRKSKSMSLVTLHFIEVNIILKIKGSSYFFYFM